MQTRVGAQGTIQLLSTGQNQPLVTLSEPLLVDPLVHLPLITLTFGFGTDEVFAPGSLFDSFTITLQSQVTSNLVVLATHDAGGLVLLPATPGGITVPPQDLVVSAAAYPSLQPVLAAQAAYDFLLRVPDQFIGQPLLLYFDLFDNLDPVPSLGFYRDLEVVLIPEPHTAGLALLGIALGLGWRIRSRVQQHEA